MSTEVNTTDRRTVTSTESNNNLGPPSRRRWVLAALAAYWCLIFTLTHIPLPQTSMPGQSDKLAHILIYGGLAFLLTWRLRLKGYSGLRQFALVMLIAAVYGALDELLQIPVGRHGDVKDWFADTVGAILGFGGFHLLRIAYNRFRSA